MKVLYLLGSARSGNTVLGRILGELEGFFLAGEVRFLWERTLQGRRCGCGMPVDRCEVWSEVLTALKKDSVSPDEVILWQQQATRVKHTRRIARLRPGKPSGWEPLDRYAMAVGRVYRTIAELTGARVIVDTSQRPSNGAALRLLPDVEPYFLHLVRDPRGVVLSLQRAKTNPDRDDPGVLQGRSLAWNVAYWSATNLAADEVRKRNDAGRSMLLRYEDFVAHPRPTVERLLRFLGETAEATPFIDDRIVELGVNHTVSGNPDRFVTGSVDIRLDDRWLREMPKRDRLLVTATSLPLLLRYGYRTRPKLPASASRP